MLQEPSFLTKGLILLVAAGAGWLVFLVAYPQHHVPGFSIASQSGWSSPPYVARHPAERAEIRNQLADNVPEKGDVPNDLLDKSKKSGKPAERRNYPADAALIINPSDWRYVKAALIVANGFGMQGQVVKWKNQHNGHYGTVSLADMDIDNEGCRQFRVSRTLYVNGDENTRIAHVDFCPDGTMR